MANPCDTCNVGWVLPHLALRRRPRPRRAQDSWPRRAEADLTLPGTTREAIRSGLRATGLAIWFPVVLAALGPVFLREWHRGSQLALVLLAVHGALTFAGLLLGLRNRWLVHGVGAVLLVAVLLLAPHRNHIDPMDLWAPGYWMLPWLAWSMVTHSRREYLTVAMVLTPLAAAADIALSWSSWHRLALAPTIWILSPVAVMVLFGDGLLQMAGRNDEMLSRRRTAQRQRADEEMRTDARHESARLMHDHVLHALHALASAGEHAEPHLVARDCRNAVAAVGASPDQAPLQPLEWVVAADPALRAANAVVMGGSTDPMPRSITRTMAAAVHEALVNVARHARASSCIVETQQDGQHWRATITDDGRGFDPAKVPANRLGLRRSVVGRLEELGGSATIESAPSRGTRVVLDWPSQRTMQGGAVLADATNRSMRLVLLRTAWPGLLSGLLMTVLMAPFCKDPLLMAAVALVVLGVGVVSTLRMRSRELSAASGVMLCAAASAGWAVNLWLAPDAVPNVFHLWMAWVGAALMHLVVLQVSALRGALLTAGWLAVHLLGLVIRFGWPLDGLRLTATVANGWGEVFLAWFCLQAARRVSQHFLTQAALVEHERRDAVRLQLTSHLDQFWSQRVTAEAMPLLRDVARGARRPGDPAVVEQARTLSLTLRDELLLGPEETRMLAMLSELRRGGWAVSSTLTHEQGRGTLDTFAERLALVGPAAHPGQPITLSTKDGAAVAVVLDPDPEQVRRWQAHPPAPDTRLDIDPDFVRLRVSRGGSTSNLFS